MNTPPTKISALWDIAVECASRREFGDCSNKLHDESCSDCKYYVCRYAPSSSTLDLLMVKAESEACELKYSHSKITMMRCIIVVPFILLILGMIMKCGL